MDGPPSYDSNVSPALTVSHDPELPAYSRRPSPSRRTQVTPVVHDYQLASQSGRAWAVLKLLGDPVLSKQIPTFKEGDDITGTLVLSLKSTDPIQAIKVSVRGQVTTGWADRESVIFLDESTMLWSKAMGDPRDPNSSPQSEYNGKLLGDYMWPFSVKLPPSVTLTGNSGGTFKLPQSFVERDTRASVQYDVVVRFVRGIMRPDSELEARIAYATLSKPEPPSLLRQLAYQENSPLLGPDADPEGWETFEPVNLQGKIFKKRHVNGTCRLSLAKPLCYTRGTVVPCYMTIECEDLQALDLLSSPEAISVRLSRNVTCQEYGGRNPTGQKWDDLVEYDESAVWWPALSGAPDLNSNQRQMQGEIHLKEDLAPSTKIAHFSIKYTVELHPFKAVAFTPADKRVLQVVPIDIATAHAAGPRTRAYAPPGYKSQNPAIADFQHTRETI